MIFKIIIILFLVAILVSLGSALYYLIGPKEKSEEIVKALTFRIGLSLTLFILLIIAFFMGWVQPHGMV